MLRAQPVYFDQYVTNLGDPTASLSGTSFAPGLNNVKGGWVNAITTPTTFDIYSLVVWINTSSTVTVDSSMLVDIGIDRAGGTSYSVLIPDLFAGWIASAFSSSKRWTFPIWIPAGSTIGVRGQSIQAVNKTISVLVAGFGATGEPSNIWCGTKIYTYGINAASSGGTLVTPATGPTWGTWTNVGGVTSRDHHALVFDVTGNVDITLDSNSMSLEIGDGSIAYGRHYSLTSGSEYHTDHFPDAVTFRQVPAGTQMKARIMTNVPGEAMHVGIWGIS